jgi:hypothetical protein
MIVFIKIFHSAGIAYVRLRILGIVHDANLSWTKIYCTVHVGVAPVYVMQAPPNTKATNGTSILEHGAISQ